MSANTTATYEFTINQIVLNAYRMASLMAVEEPASGANWEQRVQFGYQCLEMTVKRIEAQGKLVRARKFMFVPMVAGQLEYPLGSDIMDVFEDGAFIQPGDDVDAPVGTVPVKPMDMEMWQRISSNGAEGQPILYLTYRAADPLTIRVGRCRPRRTSGPFVSRRTGSSGRTMTARRIQTSRGTGRTTWCSPWPHSLRRRRISRLTR